MGKSVDSADTAHNALPRDSGASPVPTTAMSSPRTGTLDNLTGARFLAAFAVVLFHFQSWVVIAVPGATVLSPLFSAGYLGVDFFFILSGFVLAYNYMRPQTRWRPGDWGRFQALRLARIYPLHLFTLLLVAVAVAIAPELHVAINRPDAFSPQAFAANVLLIHGWTLRPEIGSWNYASWSISAEFFAYLLFPAIGLVLLRVEGRRMHFLLLVAVAIVGFAPRYLWNIPVGPLYRVIFEFTLGCLAARIYMLGQWHPSTWAIVSGAAGVAVIVLLFGLPIAHQRLDAVVPLFTLLIFSLAAGQGPLVSWLGHPWLLFGGEASYALYMTHGVTAMATGKVLSVQRFVQIPSPAQPLVLAAYLGAVLGVAAVIHVAVERPLRERIRRLVGVKTKPLLR